MYTKNTLKLYKLSKDGTRVEGYVRSVLGQDSVSETGKCEVVVQVEEFWRVDEEKKLALLFGKAVELLKDKK